MLPKSSKHYIQPTAEKLKLDPQLVEDIISFYYGLLRKAMSGLQHYNIRVNNLGSFEVKNKELAHLFEKYEKHLNILTKDTFTQMTLRKDLEERISRIIKLQEVIKMERYRKKQHLEKKYGSIRNNLESAQTDS